MTMGNLTFVGLGLYDAQDLSLKALETIRRADTVYAEFYTARLAGVKANDLEQLTGKPITVLTRHETEQGTQILTEAQTKKVVFLTCGDPMVATTHVDLRLRAQKQGIPTSIVHGSSIVTAVPGILGLQHYKFGRTTTLAYPEKDYFPTSPYMVVKDNLSLGLHTLVLLDIQEERKQYMTVSDGLDLFLRMENSHHDGLFTDETVVCGVARVGSPNPVVKADLLSRLRRQEFGPPLHTIVVPGRLHFMEIEALEILAGLPKEVGKKLQKL
jgi:diphthine synthase